MTAATTQRWVCPACRHANPVEADLCDGCGVSFTSLLRGRPTTSRAASPTTSRTGAPAVQLTAPVLGTGLTAVLEIGVVLGLLLLWKLASAVSLGDTAAAFARGRWVWQLERTMRLPSELGVQSGLLAHPDLVRVVNLFYLVAHIGSLVIFLPWMFIRHREQYRRWRNVIAVFTGVVVADPAGRRRPAAAAPAVRIRRHRCALPRVGVHASRPRTHRSAVNDAVDPRRLGDRDSDGRHLDKHEPLALVGTRAADSDRLRGRSDRQSLLARLRRGSWIGAARTRRPELVRTPKAGLRRSRCGQPRQRVVENLSKPLTRPPSCLIIMNGSLTGPPIDHLPANS